MIPIYRAKKIDSDEYVEGYYFHQEVQADYTDKEADEREEYIEHYIFSHSTHDTWDDEENFFNFFNLNKIDPSTLAIHFSDVLDSEGTKIFASLSEDGKGGDLLTTKYDTLKAIIFMGNTSYSFKGNVTGTPIYPTSVTEKFKVTGIQE